MSAALPRGRLRALVVVVGALVLGAAASRADEGTAPVAPPPQAEAAQPADEPVGAPADAPAPLESPAPDAALTPDRLEDAVFGSRLSLLARALLQFLPGLLGLAFLLTALVRWREAGPRERAAMGLGGDGPTRPFDLGAALGLFLALFGGGWLVASALASAPGLRESLESSLPFALGTVFLIEMPLAVLVILRRRRLGAGRRAGPWRALWGGWKTHCMGVAVALPLAILGGLLLTYMGRPPTVYQVVERALDPARPESLWLTGLFAVVVAPVAEESIFRGMFLPAIRHAAGGGRRGAWIAVVVVSLLFAGFHQHEASFLPLLGLALVLGYVFERTDSLATVVLGHAFFNASTVVPLLLARLEGVV